MKPDEAHLEILGRSSGVEERQAFLHKVLSNPFFLLLVDLLLGVLAYGVAWLTRIYVPIPFTADLLPQERWDVVGHPFLLLGLSQAFFIYILGLYDDLRGLRSKEVIIRVSFASALQVLAITSAFFLTNFVFPRTVILLFGTFNFLFLSGWRLYVRSQTGKEVIRVLVAGENILRAKEIVDEINGHPWMGLQLVGLAVPESAEDIGEVEGCPVLGTLQDCKSLIDRYNVDEVIFASEESWKDRLLDSLSELRARRSLRVAILPSVYEIAIGRLRHVTIKDTPLIEIRRNPSEPFERVVKRAFDLLLSAFCLTLLFPLILVVAVLIAISSPGPIFYLQDRVGRDGKVFRLIKFRTMIPNAEGASGEVLAGEGDPRITPVGKILRRLRMDEIPQVINVLKGDMSWVGPRPERPGFVRSFSESIPGYSERHKVKPGITGLAQVRAYYHTGAENKLRYDLAYIYNYNFTLDLVILLETIKVILLRRGS